MPMKDTLLSWFLLIIATLLDSYTLYIVKWRANSYGKFEFSDLLSMANYFTGFLNNIYVVCGVISFVVGIVLGYIAVTRLEITVAYPVSVGLHIVLAVLFGGFFLHESLSYQKSIGIGLVLLGIVFLAGDRQ